MQHTRQRRSFFPAAAWAGWWLLALWPLAGYWETGAQYAYGWLVPPLALLLAWRRWRTRPDPAPAEPWALPIAAAAAFTLLPSWLLAQPSPEWRVPPWLLALSAVAGTLALAAHLGGRRWLWHFAFPAAFVLTAVPWPGFVEDPIIQGLMRTVASATVAVLNLAGTPAVQRGSLVEVGTGILGVDEACSGVSSLQATLMASLFLGELHRLKTGARIALVAAGFLVALLTNLSRTCFLSFTAAREGLGAVDRWHDPAGYTVLTICLTIVALIAEVFRSRFATPAPSPSAEPPHSLPPRASVILVAWLALVLATVAAWYHRPTAIPTPGWTIAPPHDAEDYTLPASTIEMLRCDHSRSASWRDASGARWSLYFFQWAPQRSRVPLHRPEVCLPNTGLVEAGPRRIIPVAAAGFTLPFESYHFRDSSGADAFVFFCPWAVIPGVGGRHFTDDTSRAESFRRVLRRERSAGRQVAELLVTGIVSREAAEAALRSDIAALIQPTVPK